MRLRESKAPCGARIAFAAMLPLLAACSKDAPPASEAVPSYSAPAPESVFRPSDRLPAPAKSAVIPSESAPPTPKSVPAPKSDSAFDELRSRGFGDAAQVIESRVAQQKPKRKLTEEQGKLAAGYLLSDLDSMPKTRELALAMPKTAVELMIAVHERGVGKDEAEKMAHYMLRLRDSLRMENPGPLDENTSHVVGREWHEIDYSGEGMTWEAQKKFYSRHGIENFKTAENLEKFFAVESKMPYFKKLYRPRGGLPAPHGF
ncbi:MAG: hypothetical protein AB1324_05380 [Candidatus Micrarchaeota archaeon]